MTVRELMNEAIKEQYTSLILLIEMLVTEKKVIAYEDDIKVIDFYIQDKFKEKMNEHIKAFKQLKG